MNKKWPIFLVFVLTVIVFFPRGASELLVWDDVTHLSMNPVMNPVQPNSLYQIWAHPYYGLYIPVVYTLWALWVGLVQKLLYPQWAVQFIASPFLCLNLLVHVVNVGLVAKLIKRLTQSDSIHSPNYLSIALGTMAFAFHPLQVESVAWVSGFKELIWVTFALLSILSYLEPEIKTQDLGLRFLRSYRSRLILTYVFFLLAVLSKPTALILPVLLVAVDLYSSQRSPFDPHRSSVRDYHRFVPLIPMVLCTFFIMIGTRFLQSEYTQTIGYGGFDRFLVMMDSFGFYLRKILLPVSLAPDYGRTPEFILGQGLTVEQGIFLVALLPTAGIIQINKGFRSIFVLALSFFVIPIFPLSGVIPFAYQNYSTVADRYGYFSLVGLSILITATLNPFSKKAFGVLGILIVWFFLSSKQVSVWRTNQSLLDEILRINPKSYMAENNKGVLLLNQNKPQEALIHFWRALEMNSSHISAALNVGDCLERLGDRDQAIHHYQNIVSNAPNLFAARAGLGRLLLKANRCQQAILQLEVAHQLEPDNTEVINDLIETRRLNGCAP